jgi:hypothetical protein
VSVLDLVAPNSLLRTQLEMEARVGIEPTPQAWKMNHMRKGARRFFPAYNFACPNQSKIQFFQHLRPQLCITLAINTLTSDRGIKLYCGFMSRQTSGVSNFIVEYQPKL